ncbi:ferritin-like domain-containing protein [Emticicia sp. C21]|uniref:ferritin-like domain-containing protein n=1 Tax=Emticicia sp. C21 TaxID=2302915 RepID=UPI000E34B464|nr:ferritin-like domain-containing protein [Emticicia sp. C21]RFS14835.1 ferritin-like domain-containing protein [Emticicia sp. C21]
MNFFHIISELEKVDADVHERLEHISRRSMFNTLGKKVSALAIPAVLAASLQKAYAATPGAIDILNFALTLEYLEDDFYKAGLAAANLIPASDKPIFQQISKHESAHVALLKSALGAKAIAKPTFDVTGKGAFADVLTNYKTYAIVSHALEDTGVRAYKGQAGNLMTAEDKPLLQTALQIHSVEARHASMVRRLLNAKGFVPGAKGWITLNQGTPAAVYAGDDNLTQAGVNLTGLAGKSNEAISEAFDEPLTKDQVLAIATPFIKS